MSEAPLPPPVPEPLPPLPGGPQPTLNYLGVGALVCPRCTCPHAQPVNFTWWGGFLGPKLLNHVKCVNCGFGYNAKTGRPNTTGIIIYTIVGAVIGIVVFAMLLWMRA